MQYDMLPEMGPNTYYRNEKWTHRHDLLVTMSAAGYTQKQIAEELEMTQSRVSVILGDPRAHLRIKEIGEKVVDGAVDVMSKLRFHANEALDEIISEMRTAEDVRVKQKASFGILDRAGYTPIQRQLVGSFDISGDVADRMKEALDESKEVSATYAVK